MYHPSSSEIGQDVASGRGIGLVKEKTKRGSCFRSVAVLRMSLKVVL